MQGVIKSYDPTSGEGSLLRDTDLGEVLLAPDALAGSVFRMLRQGQRVVFDLDQEGRATRLRLGSEVDMGTRGFDPTTGAEVLEDEAHAAERTGPIDEPVAQGGAPPTDDTPPNGHERMA